jgi:Bacteriophage tail sheath protein
MPVQTSYPGIYIEELPSSAHTITAAPTSITVFVGYTHPFKTNPNNWGQAIEIFSYADYEREFGGSYESGLIDSNVADAVNMFFLNGGSDAFVVALQPKEYTDSQGNSDSKAVSAKGAIKPATMLFGTAPNAIEFTALEPVDSVSMTVTISNPQKTVAAGDTADLVVSYGTKTETYRKVNLIHGDPNYIETRIGTAANPVSSLVTVSPDSAYPTTYPFPAGKTVMQDTSAFTTPGGAIGVFDPADFAPVFQADSNLDKVPIFNLLVVPGIINAAVLSEALAFCERKFAFLIMDPPLIDTADGGSTDYIGKFIDQSGDANSNVAPLSQNGALYFPYLQSFDPVTANPINLPPSGFVAGIFANTDTNRGVWKAPAGLAAIILNTTGVVPAGLMTDPRQGDLNNKGVNCLRSFSTGTVVFGARTLVSSNPAFQQWKYVPVRRMALFIEQTLRANLTWVIFEPNDSPLWTAIRTSIEGFMLSLFNQGALQGATPSQAFQVKCDSSTTTQDDINNGIVNIIVAFAPLKPAEFVVIKIAQLAGQAQA